jgi:hypothetical protein
MREISAGESRVSASLTQCILLRPPPRPVLLLAARPRMAAGETRMGGVDPTCRTVGPRVRGQGRGRQGECAPRTTAPPHHDPRSTVRRPAAPRRERRGTDRPGATLQPHNGAPAGSVPGRGRGPRRAGVQWSPCLRRLVARVVAGSGALRCAAVRKGTGKGTGGGAAGGRAQASLRVVAVLLGAGTTAGPVPRRDVPHRPAGAVTVAAATAVAEACGVGAAKRGGAQPPQGAPHSRFPQPRPQPAARPDEQHGANAGTGASSHIPPPPLPPSPLPHPC